MGTSSSFGGPGDTKPLLPSWALEPVVPAPPPGPPLAPEQPLTDGPIPVVPDGAPPQSDESPLPNPTPQPATPQLTVVLPRKPSAPWRAAKRRMGRVASDGGRGAIAAAARSYVRAEGGARQAARTARASRAATAAFGGFLADTVRRGLGEALRRLGGLVIGKDAVAAFAAIVDAIAPAGASPRRRLRGKGLWRHFGSSTTSSACKTVAGRNWKRWTPTQ